MIERLRDGAARFGSEFGMSAWNGFALARFCGPDAAKLRRDVVALLNGVDSNILPRIWLG